MVSKTTLAVFEFETIYEYFEYIIDSRTNGQHVQAKELYHLLSKQQRADFFNWAGETYYYEAQDSEEMCELNALRSYFENLVV